MTCNDRSYDMLKAIIFDFDGTILDTEVPWYEAFSDLYHKHNKHLPLTLYSKIIGANTSSTDYIDPYRHLMEQVDEPLDYQELVAFTHERHQELMKDKTLQPGVQELLQFAKDANYKLGLASSSSRKWVLHYLDQLGILHYFDCIKTSDDVVRSKPDPELYLEVLKALNISSEETFAIEDSPNGCLAAKKAGLVCLVIPHAITEEMVFPDHDLRLKSLSDLSINQLLEQLNFN